MWKETNKVLSLLFCARLQSDNDAACICKYCTEYDDIYKVQNAGRTIIHKKELRKATANYYSFNNYIYTKHVAQFSNMSWRKTYFLRSHPREYVVGKFKSDKSKHCHESLESRWNIFRIFVIIFPLCCDNTNLLVVNLSMARQHFHMLN